MNVLDAMRDPALFGSAFANADDWRAWRVFLAALFALPVSDPADVALYRECTGRHALPTTPAREAYVIAGRRGGKSRIAALVAVYLATFEDYSRLLAPGERGTVAVIAADRRQARTLMRYVEGFLAAPLLAKMVQRRSEDAIDLTNGCTIEIHTASFRAVRGYTLVGVIADEIAFWRTDEGSANPDAEILQAVRPGMATVPGALLLAISSPYSRRGALWEAYRKHFGTNGDTLVWQAPSRTMHPALPGSVIAAAYEADPAAAAAEYGAQFRTDLEAFVTSEVLDAVIVPGRFELPPLRGVAYVAFVDPSGGSVDAMTLGVAHLDGKVAVLDLVREVRPPFSPEAVVAEFAQALALYRVDSVVGDRYGAGWVEEAFRKAGIGYTPSEHAKSAIYSNALALLNSARCELLDLARLRSQLLGLERRTARGGRDSIDHAPRSHDDVANAACGALTLVSARSSRQVVRRVLWNGEARYVDSTTGLLADEVPGFGRVHDVRWIVEDDDWPRLP